ncbi:MAG: restriction endonuclease subunit S [Lachnospiraceae bacterium]
MEFTKTTLGEISVGKGQYGIGASAVDYSEDLYTYLRITDINDDGTLNYTDLKSVDDEKAGNYILQPNDIVFARTGNSTGRNYFYDGTDGTLVYAGFLIKFSIDPAKVNPKYVKYYCLSEEYKGWVRGFSTGSTRGNINAQTYGNMPITLPPRKQQDKMVRILDDLELKRANNVTINRNLLEQARLLYKSWFMDFDNNGGVMPDDWHIGTVSEIIELHDSKRKPLSGNERDKLKKIYPYYGATSIMDYVDDYLFDGIYLLLGEDGSVIDAEGYPILQYVFGKFWCNNHAHIITGKNGFSVEALYLLFSLTHVNDIVTGAVQLKISQQNLNKVEAVIPSLVALKEFDEIIQPMFGQIRKLRLENENLTKIRDRLLPNLMSGELDVSDLDI